MIHPIQIINAVAVDEKHLELKEPLSKEAGKKFKIAIILEDGRKVCCTQPGARTTRMRAAPSGVNVCFRS